MQNPWLFIGVCTACFFAGTAFGMCVQELRELKRRARR